MDTGALVRYLKSLVLVLLPQNCYDEFFVKYNFLNVLCLKATVSKGLGLSIVAGSLMVKVPQIVKICANRSATGLSFASVLMDLYAVTTGVTYSYRNLYPFSAWGDSLFLLIQTVLIAVLVLHYNHSSLLAAIFVAVFSSIFAVLLSDVTPVDLLWSLQAVSVPIMFCGKMIQAYANYTNSSTGQLSVITCIMLLFGSTARIFTSVQETGDAVIILTYSLATLGNLIIVAQFVYYGYKGSQTSGKSKKAKKNPKKIQ